MKKTQLVFLYIVIAVILVALGRAFAVRWGGVRRDTVDNRPLLKNSVLIDHFEAPNLVVTSTGDRLHLNGFVFNEHISEATPKTLQEVFRHHDPIRIAADPTQPSGVGAELRIEYWCGNSFHQSFWPKPPLPRYRVADLGQSLSFLGVGDLTIEEQNKP
jgi:hypothetical protein